MRVSQRVDGDAAGEIEVAIAGRWRRAMRPRRARTRGWRARRSASPRRRAGGGRVAGAAWVSMGIRAWSLRGGSRHGTYLAVRKQKAALKRGADDRTMEWSLIAAARACVRRHVVGCWSDRSCGGFMGRAPICVNAAPLGAKRKTGSRTPRRSRSSPRIFANALVDKAVSCQTTAFSLGCDRWLRRRRRRRHRRCAGTITIGTIRRGRGGAPAAAGRRAGRALRSRAGR